MAPTSKTTSKTRRPTMRRKGERKMTFVNRLLEKFRAQDAAAAAVEQDIFNLRLMRMQGRGGHAAKHSPFRNPRMPLAA